MNVSNEEIDNLHMLYKLYIVLSIKKKIKLSAILNMFEFFLTFAWKLNKIERKTVLHIISILESMSNDKYYNTKGTEERIPQLDMDNQTKLLYKVYGILSESNLLGEYRNQ